jgi:hypothetical protein
MSNPPQKPASAPQDAASQIDGAAVAQAYRKLMDRKELTKQERRLLKRHEKDKEERLRWQYYDSIPQKHWRQMSGRQAKVINEQATRYGIPFDGPTVSLSGVVRALHNFLTDNAQKLARDEDLLMQGSGSLALEEYRQERAKLARLDRLERERQLIPRDEARAALGRTAAILRSAGDALQRQFGTPAVEILFEALDDCQREIEHSFGDGQQQEPEQLSLGD